MDGGGEQIKRTIIIITTSINYVVVEKESLPARTVQLWRKIT